MNWWTVLVWMSLAGAGVAAWLLTLRRCTDDPTRRGGAILLGLALPPLGLCAPFVAAGGGAGAGLSSTANFAAYASAGFVTAVFAFLCLLLILEVGRHHSSVNDDRVAAALICLSALHALGRYLQTRLTVVVDPRGDFTAILDRLWDDKIQMLLPVAALAFVVLAVGLRRAWADRIGEAWRRTPFAAWPETRRRALETFAVCVPVVLLYLLPLFGSSENGAHLTFLRLRTPELGSVALFFAVAVISARRRERLRLFAWWRAHWTDWSTYRSWLAPALLVFVTALSVARNDLGSVVAATAGYTASRIVLYRELTAETLQASGTEQTWRTHPVRRYARFWIPGVLFALILVFVAASASGKQQRFDVWADPWQYPFVPTSQCVPADEAGVAVADLRPAVDVPPGTEACVTFAGGVDLSRFSQMAKGLVAIEGGGLWGRGIGDSHTGAIRVPLLQSDFVIATIWSKAGALGVLVVSLLLVAFGGLTGSIMQRDHARWTSRPVARRRATLYAAGFAAGVTWQGVFVLLTNVGLLPHSGIPFPMVAEGSQASAALVVGFGVLLLLVCADAQSPHTTPRETNARTDSRSQRNEGRGLSAAVRTLAPLWRSVPEPEPDSTESQDGSERQTRALTSTTLAAGVCALAVLWGLMFPFAALHPDDWLPDLERGWAAPYVRAKVAGTTPDEVRATGWLTLTRREGGRWTSDAAEPDPAMWEFLTEYGSGDGFNDRLLASDTTAVHRTFWDRLHLPTVLPPSVTQMSVDADLQRFAHDIVREPVTGRRLGTGLTVVRARTGQVLALASAPNPTDVTDPPAVTEALKALNDAEAERSSTSGFRSLATDKRSCSGDDCISVRWQRVPSQSWLPDDPTMSTYQGLASNPRSLENRTFVRSFGAGSTFKVVVAATYLDNGGRPDDLLASPASLYVDGRDIQNVYDGACPGTADGRLTLAQALAVSCNTTFVLLARTLGWDAISDMAWRLGLQVEGRRTPRCALRDATRIPADSSSGIENLVLGGGDIQVTPNAIASMMATIAADGRRTQLSGTSGTVATAASRPSRPTSQEICKPPYDSPSPTAHWSA